MIKILYDIIFYFDNKNVNENNSRNNFGLYEISKILYIN